MKKNDKKNENVCVKLILSDFEELFIQNQFAPPGLTNPF